MNPAVFIKQEARHFLFLQGPSSPIFRKIGVRLSARGYKVSRINICAGDWMFWHGPATVNYRGRPGGWSRFVEDFVTRHGVTDAVLLGEERPHHKAAIEIFARHGVDVYVVEMGYLRPDWLTLERGGMSTNSHFPNDPQQIVAAAAGLPEPDLRPKYSHRFWAEALSDLAYNLPNVFFWFLYPHYRGHAIDHPLAEYAGWLRKLLMSRHATSQARKIVETVLSSQTPFFLFPLQLDTDYQIRAHSPFTSQAKAIEGVIHAFAETAPGLSHLIFKVHPLDNGLRDWAKMCRETASRLGVSQRVHCLATGDLRQLLNHTRGVVTINSTVGIHALLGGCPVKALGTAIFDVAGLVDPQSLQGFFQQPLRPNPRIRDAFIRLLAATIQLRGNFYSRLGSDAGADAIAERLGKRLVNQPGAFVEVPPRRVTSHVELPELKMMTVDSDIISIQL